MLQVGNKSLIIHLVYLLPMSLGTVKHYIVIIALIALLLPPVTLVVVTVNLFLYLTM